LPFEELWETLLTLTQMEHCLDHQSDHTNTQTFEAIFYYFESMGIVENYNLGDLFKSFGMDYE
jgi:hypothetical protein